MVPQRPQCVAGSEVKLDSLFEVRFILRKMSKSPQGVVETCKRLLVGRAFSGLEAGLAEVQHCFVPDFAAHGMAGKSLHALGEPARIKPLHRLDDGCVQRLAMLP